MYMVRKLTWTDADGNGLFVYKNVANSRAIEL